MKFRVKPKTPDPKPVLDGRLNMRTVDIRSLVPASYNPRRMKAKNKAGLSKSLDTYGLVQPIIYNERTGHVVGGHQRLDLLLMKGVKETDVVVLDIPLAREKELNITLNNNNITGDFDTPMLNDMLLDMDADIKEAMNMDVLELHNISSEFEFEDEEKALRAMENKKRKQLFIVEVYFIRRDDAQLFIGGLGSTEQMKRNNIMLNGDELE